MSFDRLAPYYRQMEWVLAGGLLQRCRTTFLAEARSCRRALLLGEGPGRFLGELLRTNAGITVVCVEQSARMIQAAQQNLTAGELARVEFVQADARCWQPPPAQFDLIGTHFFLDCFRRAELAQLIAVLAAGATAEACWLVTDFCEPRRGWRRWRGRGVLALMYFFFRGVTGLSAAWITPPDGFLSAVGFQMVARRSANHGLIHADLWRRKAV